MLNLRLHIVFFPGCTNVMGKFNYGHTGIVGLGYRNANSRFVVEETLRTYQAINITDYDEKYYRTSCLSNNRYIYLVICG